jgi:hypothetical protein
MCVAGPNQLPLYDLQPSARNLQGAGGARLHTVQTGKLSLTFSGALTPEPSCTCTGRVDFGPRCTSTTLNATAST